MTMRGKVFLVGFGISLVLLAVCTAYGISPTWQRSILLRFDISIDHVSLPNPFNYSIAAFALLNIPPVVVVTFLVAGLSRALALSPPQIAITALLLSVVASALWWWLLGTFGRWFRGRRVRSSGVTG